jgi:hypothetical protein
VCLLQLSFSSKRISSSQQRDGTVTLQLNKLENTDAGVYTCIAIMADGTEVHTKTNLSLAGKFLYATCIVIMILLFLPISFCRVSFNE